MIALPPGGLRLPPVGKRVVWGSALGLTVSYNSQDYNVTICVPGDKSDLGALSAPFLGDSRCGRRGPRCKSQEFSPVTWRHQATGYCVGREVYRTDLYWHDSVLCLSNPPVLKEETEAEKRGNSSGRGGPPPVLTAHHQHCGSHSTHS